jgi:hypothetical protein
VRLLRKRMTVPLRHPFTMIVSRPTGSCKTQFVMRLIDHAETIVSPPPENIVYCYMEYQPETFEPYRFRGVQF